MLKPILSGEPSGTAAYAVLFQGLRYLLGQSFYISLFNFYLYMIALALFLQLTTWRIDWPITWLMLLCWVFPETVSLVLFQNRDSTFSLATIVLALGFLLRRRGIAPYGLSYVHLLACGLLTANLRQDGILILPFLPMLFALTAESSFSWRNFVKHAGAVALGSILLYQVVPRLVPLRTLGASYRTTALINPLSYIVQKEGLEKLPPESLQQLSRFFRIDYLQKYYDPYEIPAYHLGGIKNEASTEDYEAFQLAALDLFAKYPKRFVENRNQMFLRMFNFNGHGFMYYSHLRDGDPQFKDLIHREIGIQPMTAPNIFERAHFYVMEITANDLPFLLKLLLVSGLIPISFLVFSCCRLKKDALVATLALFFLGRMAMTYLLSPAGSFKYVAAIWLGGWLLFWIYLSQRMSEKRGEGRI